MRILVVEDDPWVANLLRKALEGEGYAVDVVDSGDDAIWMAQAGVFGAVVLDVGIPAPDGLEVTRQLRANKCWTPILLLTGRGQIEDRVAGLDAGADDYLAKPFAVEELHARLRALTRRLLVDRPAVHRLVCRTPVRLKSNMCSPLFPHLATTPRPVTAMPSCTAIRTSRSSTGPATPSSSSTRRCAWA